MYAYKLFPWTSPDTEALAICVTCCFTLDCCQLGWWIRTTLLHTDLQWPPAREWGCWQAECALINSLTLHSWRGCVLWQADLFSIKPIRAYHCKYRSTKPYSPTLWKCISCPFHWHQLCANVYDKDSHNVMYVCTYMYMHVDAWHTHTHTFMHMYMYVCTYTLLS